jgi:small subunit ribosomal protein S4
MGTVTRLKRKYSGPNHPWEAVRIEEERIYKKEYGFKNKKEIWKSTSKIRKIKSQAKKLIASTTEQSRKEEKLLIDKLVKLGILKEGKTLDNILEIGQKELFNRRLQSMVLSKGLARTSKQARQMITHGHITINGRKTNIPSYLVQVSEEKSITYSPNSSFNDKEHPERNIGKKEIMAVKKPEVQAETKVEQPQEAAN